LTIIPIQGMIQTSGYEATFLWFGLGHGMVVVALSFLLRAPSPGKAPPSIRLRQSSCDYTPLEALGSHIFWVMYVMFVLVGAGGLMVTAQLAPIAIDFQIAKTPVSLLGLTLPALTFAPSIDRVLNGLTRPFFGWLSDHIGRENTMFMALGLRGCRYLGSQPIRPRPRSVRDLGRGCILRLARDLLSVPFDLHRCLRRQVRDHQCGFALHCKGTASLLVPLANVLAAASRDWRVVFLAAALMNVVAAIMALAVLKPLRAVHDRTADRMRPARLQHP
jgi:OFA family oxalate/formate antiporter-like MFS transporter